MSDKAEPKNNSDRLLKHLKDGSLAARLVEAYRIRDAADPSESMKAVLRERLEQTREKIDGAEA